MSKTAAAIARQKRYLASPKGKETRRRNNAAYVLCPEAKARQHKYLQTYTTTSPVYKAWVKLYTARPEVKLRAKTRAGVYRLRKFGLTEASYAALRSRQNGVCAICHGCNTKGRQLSIDHSHATGSVRGLLCQKCNVALGLLGETSTLVLKAYNYLKAASAESANQEPM